MLGLIGEEAVGAGELLGGVGGLHAVTGGALHPLSGFARSCACVAILAIVVALAYEADEGQITAKGCVVPTFTVELFLGRGGVVPGAHTLGQVEFPLPVETKDVLENPRRPVEVELSSHQRKRVTERQNLS